MHLANDAQKGLLQDGIKRFLVLNLVEHNTEHSDGDVVPPGIYDDSEWNQEREFE